MVRTRIAPSPTGMAHVGNAWMALFNFAFTKQKKGEFIIRIDDTDIDRNIKGAEKKVLKGLRWLGLSWDKGPLYQSKRLDLYNKYLKKLQDKKLVYKDDGAVRFKNPKKNISWHDLVRGEVSFPGEEVQDFVLIKSNGIPTYHFASVVDDIDLKITHIIRGEEHVSNTPKHIALFNALESDLPKFAHLPTLRNQQKKKLSKRRDKVDLEQFKKDGYLPEALVNFLCLLGWSHPDEKEIFSLDEFIKHFSFDRIKKAGPMFDTTKLDWINGEYIRAISIEELTTLLSPKDHKDIKKIVGLAQTRIKTLTDFKTLTNFFFTNPKVNKKLFKDKYKVHLKVAHQVISNLSEWNLENLNKDLLKAIDDKSFSTGKFFMSLRIAITGSKATPPINESIIILGKKETLDRINKLL